MINGNTTEFLDKLWNGEELIFVYNEKKYFSQGYINDSGEYVLELQMWEPKVKTLWHTTGKTNQESYEEFIRKPLFDGNKFWAIEPKIEWVDC